MIKSNILGLRLKENNFFLYLAFFALGFGRLEFYFPLFALYFFLKGSQILAMPIRSSYLILTGLMLIATAPLYIFGADRMTNDDPVKSLMPLLFSLTVAGFLLQNKTQDIQFRLIATYIFGLGSDALVMVGYSYWVDSARYGYGLLLNPFNGKESNSPGTSNTLSIMAALLIYYLFQKQTLVKRLAVIVLMIITLVAAFFLGGRTFFIILAISFLIMLFFGIKQSQIPKFFLYGAVFIVFGLTLISSIDFMHEKLEITLQRLSFGLESNRFLHYSHGMNIFLDYPFGGFSVDAGIENTEWFHNIFLDNARIGGWFPVLSLIFAMLYIGSTLIFKKSQYLLFGYLLVIISFLIMQQDVILEGNFRVFIVMFFSGILLHANNSN
jgi:hypothetical protein